ncbi:UDP-N-acetylglucosamine 1-carboxyvinyltransferase [Streptomyces sp. NPDC048506]|uniref:UDP-N-acetylglucosamine 1-carboxyvinyltransferase n=1 Tax=Streptomyces sp. NPDC048506 TaxID=3155028 RepID=UPI00341829EF
MTVTKSPYAGARTATVRPGRPLSGVIRVDGSKAATLILLAAAASTRRPVKLDNVPADDDTLAMLTLIKSCGYHIARPVTSPDTVVMLPTPGRSSAPDLAGASQFRSSYYLVPVLLASRGQAALSWPPGDGIGDRRMELHFGVYKAFGDTVETDEYGYRVRATDNNRDHVQIRLPCRSRSASVAAIARAVISRTPLQLRNPNLSPEVISLLTCLSNCGWKVWISRDMVTFGPPSHGQDCALPWTVPGDKVAAGALACAIAVTGGAARIEGIHSRDVAPVVDALRQLGIPTIDEPDAITVHADQARPTNRPLWAAASLNPHGLDSDLEPSLIAVALGMPGIHTFADAINPRRHAKALCQLTGLGAQFDEISPSQCRLTGPQRLTGGTVQASGDFGTASALLVAGLTARGTTTITGLDRIRQQHADLPAALRHLGADITEVPR